MNAVSGLEHMRKSPWFSRRTLITICLVMCIPMVVLSLVRLFATETPDNARIEVARLVLEEYVRRNPPNENWQMTETRISEQGKLIMDVNVPDYDDAQYILSRTGRVRNSYLKLACPSVEANVYDQLPEGETVWVNLHYNGTPIVEGACPLAKALF